MSVIEDTTITESSPNANANVAPLLKRAFMFLEDGDWTSADKYCERVLDIDPENAQAYFGKLMAELHVKKQDMLKDQAEPFNDSINYQKAIRFADENFKTVLTGYIEYINTRNENARLEGIYNQATSTMRSAKNSAEYEDAANIFKTILNYKDSEILVAKCHEKAEIARKEAARIAKRNKKMVSIATPIVCAIIAFMIVLNTVIIPNNKYDDASALMEAGKYIDAISAFEALNGYRDSEDKITECNTAIMDSKYNDALALMETGKYIDARFAFEKLNGYKDSTDKITECKYNEALALMDGGKYTEAITAFKALNGYKDSEDKANSVYKKYKEENLENAKVGDYVFFGTYEQDNNTSNGKEYIEWLVLEVKDGKALVISKYAIDHKIYNTSKTISTWETCSLRKWLNELFINVAFSDDEKAVIPTTMVSADENPDFTTSGNPTYDQAFLLSITEVNKYFSNDSARQCKPTDYAVERGVFIESPTCTWWLRTEGFYMYYATYVSSSGRIGTVGCDVNSKGHAVRPAMWIDLSLL